MTRKPIAPRELASAASMSADWPYRCTGMIALIRPPVARLISCRRSDTHCSSMKACTAAGDRLKVSGSMSQNTGRAPTRAIVPAVAKKVNGEVITSSPGADPEGHQREQQRIGAGGHADAGRRAAVLRDFRFERAHVLAEDEVLTGAHALDDRHHFGANLRELRLKIE